MSESLTEILPTTAPIIDAPSATVELLSSQVLVERLRIGNQQLEQIEACELAPTLRSIKLELVACKQETEMEDVRRIGLNGLYRIILPSHDATQTEVGRLEEKLSRLSDEHINPIKRIIQTRIKFAPERAEQFRILEEEQIDAAKYEHPELGETMESLTTLANYRDDLEDVLEIAGQPWPLPNAIYARDNDLDEYATKWKITTKKGFRQLRDIRKRVIKDYLALPEPDRVDTMALFLAFNMCRTMSYAQFAEEAFSDKGNKSLAEKVKSLSMTLGPDSEEHAKLQAKLSKFGLQIRTGTRRLHEVDGQTLGRLRETGKFLTCLPAGRKYPSHNQYAIRNRTYFVVEDWTQISSKIYRGDSSAPKERVQIETASTKEVDWRTDLLNVVNQELKILASDGILHREDLHRDTVSRLASRRKIGTERSKELQLGAGLIGPERAKSDMWSAREMLFAVILNANRRKLGKEAPEEVRKEALRLIERAIETKLAEQES